MFVELHFYGSNFVRLQLRGTIFDQRDNTINALTDRVSGRDLFKNLVLWLTREVIAWLPGLRCALAQSIGEPFAIGLGDRQSVLSDAGCGVARL